LTFESMFETQKRILLRFESLFASKNP